MKLLPFSKIVEINPRVGLDRGQYYPFVSMGVVEPSKRYISSVEQRSYKGGGAKFIAGDTLFARITPCLENGKIVQYKPRVGNKAAFGSTEFFVFRAYPHITDPGYVYYLARSDLIRKPAEKSMSGASGRQRADLNSIKNVEVPAPTLYIQRKITAILSAYDNLIENNLRRIRILEEMAQALYREWFVHFRFPGHEKVRFVDSPLGKIPEGWVVRTVGELLVKVKRKKRIKRQDYQHEGPVPIVDQGKEKIGGYTNDINAVHEWPLPVIVFGDHTRVLKYVDFPFASGADGTQLLVSNTPEMSMSLFFHTLKAIDLSDYAYARHFKWLKEEQIALPSVEISKLFSEKADLFIDLTSSLRNINLILICTRDLLLPKLISGELDVSELDIDVSDVS